MENARTWMVATLGPSTSDDKLIKSLFEAGVDIFRINLSHSNLKVHRTLIRAAAETGAHVMVDLPGPKVRIDGASVDLPFDITAGQQVLFAAEDGAPKDNDKPVFAVSAPIAWARIEPGSRILVDDGNLDFVVVDGGDAWVAAEAIDGGVIWKRKGVAFDKDVVDAPDVLPEDVNSLEELKDEPLDYVAVSFARNAECISGLREAAGKKRKLIAKIEDPAGMRNAEEIIRTADGVMVARGDLGVCLPLPALPILQKRLIALANYHRRPVIVATQMLESMVEHLRPTRAEVTDVANAVFDGADMLMLSAETAIGKHPLRAVEMLASIIAAAEEAVRTGLRFQL